MTVICGDWDDDGLYFKTMSDGGKRDLEMAEKIHQRMIALNIKSDWVEGSRRNYMTMEDLYKYLEIENVRYIPSGVQ